MKAWMTAAAGVLALGGAAAAQDGLPEGARLEILASGLEHPWSLALLPDGGALVTEKPGRLRHVAADGSLREAPIEGVPDVLYSGQGGLLEVALHPQFQENSVVYLTWSDGDPRDNTLKLGRGQFDGERLFGFEEIFSAEPRRPTDVHYGARLTFLPDGTLLLGIGDGFDFREEAQRPASHYGSFVHLNADGTPASQAVEGGAPGVFSYGHRNPQAVARDPQTGIIYANEHGPRGGDEINILQPGGNYGWPIASFGIDYTGGLVTPFTAYDGMIDPILYWTPSIAPGGMAIYRGEMFPEWEGDLLVAALIAGEPEVRAGHIRLVDLEDGAVAGQSVMLDDLGYRFRDVRVAADGSVYALTDEADGALMRIAR